MTTTISVADHYRTIVQQGDIEHDPVQLQMAVQLDRVAQDLKASKPTSNGFFSFLSRQPEPEQTRGLYIYGGVGRGKTMLMDLFFELVAFEPKRRLHFHQFMAETHELIGEARHSVEGDPIPTVAKTIAKDAQLLCFDELHVTDIADAMVLSRLFKGLFESGVVVVATSNAAPTELYRHGLNRQLFLPFIDLVQLNMEVFELVSAKDYRRDKLAGAELYLAPADHKARQALDRHWLRLTGHQKGPSTALSVKGREVHVPQASKGVARFSFDDLCAKPLGTLDYLQIAQSFHTVLIDDIPRLTPDKRNEARRFINLIDTLYDARVCLIASADAMPDELYKRGDGADLFHRTASRLTEMRSETYLDSRSARGIEAEGPLV